MELTIWHNPRCSKSRQTLALLQDRGVTPTVVEYLKTPPSAEDLREILGLLGIGARALMRTKEARYRDLELAGVDDEQALINAMADNPILIERPVVRYGAKAAIGRPPETVLDLL